MNGSEEELERANGIIERNGGLRFRICRWKPLMAEGRRSVSFLSNRSREKKKKKKKKALKVVVSVREADERDGIFFLLLPIYIYTFQKVLYFLI